MVGFWNLSLTNGKKTWIFLLVVLLYGNLILALGFYCGFLTLGDLLIFVCFPNVFPLFSNELDSSRFSLAICLGVFAEYNSFLVIIIIIIVMFIIMVMDRMNQLEPGQIEGWRNLKQRRTAGIATEVQNNKFVRPYRHLSFSFQVASSIKSCTWVKSRLMLWFRYSYSFLLLHCTQLSNNWTKLLKFRIFFYEIARLVFYFVHVLFNGSINSYLKASWFVWVSLREFSVMLKVLSFSSLILVSQVTTYLVSL